MVAARGRRDRRAEEAFSSVSTESTASRNQNNNNGVNVRRRGRQLRDGTDDCRDDCSVGGATFRRSGRQLRDGADDCRDDCSVGGATFGDSTSKRRVRPQNQHQRRGHKLESVEMRFRRRSFCNEIWIVSVALLLLRTLIYLARLTSQRSLEPTAIDYPGLTVANHESDVAITFIAVVSMQRSSSTFLSHQVLAGEKESEKLAIAPLSACPLHHFISLNEIFQTYEQQSGDAWSIEGKELLNGGQRKVFDLTALELVDFLQSVAKRKCRQQIARDRSRGETSTRLESCPEDTQVHKHHCFVNFKQFDNQLTLEQHEQVWKSLPDLRIIILERAIEERWKSFWYAQKTGDWGVSGTSGHKESIAKSQPPDIPSPFRERHERWYSRVRELTGSGGSLGHIPSLDVSFASVVSDPVGMRKQAMQMILPLEPTQPPLAAEKKVEDFATTSKFNKKMRGSHSASIDTQRDPKKPLMGYYQNLHGKSEDGGVSNQVKLTEAVESLRRFSARYYIYDDPSITQSSRLANLRAEEYVERQSLSLDHLQNDVKGESRILEALANHPLKVDKPGDATFFVIPLAISELLLRGCRWEDCDWFDEAFHSLQKQESFSKSLGANHVLVSLSWLSFNDRYSAYFPALGRNFRRLQNVTVAHNYDPFGVRRLLNQQNTDPDNKSLQSGFHHLYPLELPVTNSFSLGLGYDCSFPIRQASYENFENSRYFLFYHTRDTEKQPFGFGSSKYRDAALKPAVIKSLPRSSIGNEVPQEAWLGELKSSQFCLVVRGDTPHSHSLLYAIRSGCIPVVVSDDYEEYAGTFKSSLSMRDYCVFIREDDFLRDPLKELQQLLNMTKGRIEGLLRSLSLAQRIIFPDHPESLFVQAFLKELKTAQSNDLFRTLRSATRAVDSTLMIGDTTIQYRFSEVGDVAFSGKGDLKGARSTSGKRINVVVVSPPEHSNQRFAIRNTWTKDQNVLFVLLGGSWEDIEEEFLEHGDMVWVKESASVDKGAMTVILDQVGFDAMAKKYGSDYDYVFSTPDDGFVFVREAQVLLDDSPRDFWGVCEVDIEGRGSSSRIASISYRDDSLTVDVESMKSGRHEFASAEKVGFSEMGYFVSRNFTRCMSQKLQSAGRSEWFPAILEQKSLSGRLLTHILAGQCDIVCNSDHWSKLRYWDEETQETFEFIAEGVERTDKMLFLYWDAQKARHLGEWAADS